MNDLLQAGKFFSLFAIALLVYGAALNRTGEKNLLPYRARHSVQGPQDVKRVGRIVVYVALAILASAGLLIAASILLVRSS